LMSKGDMVNGDSGQLCCVLRTRQYGCGQCLLSMAAMRKCAGRRTSLLLEVAVLAAVEAVLVRLDSLFTLRGHGDPMLYRRVPVQIAILDDLAYFEKPRVILRSWHCLVCRAHTAL
jgi:hypothetical protein